MFKFAHPYFLNLLWGILVFTALYVLMRRQKRINLLKAIDERLFSRIMPDYSSFREKLKFILLLLAWTFLVIGLADPQVGSKLEKIKRKGIDMVFVLDVSNSMLAQDISPNRLERSKQAISRLLDNLGDDRVGLVVFAGKAYVQMPITNDFQAAKLFLSSISPDLVPTQGTNISEAISTSVNCFGNSKQSKAIIVITDGENHESDAVDAAARAADKGIHVFTIGVGLPEGSPIPIYNGNTQIGYKKDRNGNTIISRLDESLLQSVAAAGKGIYVRANNTSVGVKEVFRKLSTMDKTEYDARFFSDYDDKFQIFLLIALIILIFEIAIVKRKSRWADRIKIFKPSNNK